MKLNQDQSRWCTLSATLVILIFREPLLNGVCGYQPKTRHANLAIVLGIKLMALGLRNLYF